MSGTSGTVQVSTFTPASTVSAVNDSWPTQPMTRF